MGSMHARPRLAGLGAWLVALSLWIVLMPASAQDVLAPEELAPDDADARAPATGDDWIDAQLADVNRYAERYRAAFVDELVRYQAAPRPLVEQALDADVAAGDAYYACALAQAFGRPCREVLDAWRANPGDGWDGVARKLEPDRAGAARDRVKRGIVDSYDRWARPLSLDASLRRALPDRQPPAR